MRRILLYAAPIRPHPLERPVQLTSLVLLKVLHQNSPLGCVRGRLKRCVEPSAVDLPTGVVGDRFGLFFKLVDVSELVLVLVGLEIPVTLVRNGRESAVSVNTMFGNISE